MFQGLQCPHCSAVTLAPLDKLLLSPQTTRACRYCGGRYATSRSTWTLMLGSALVLLAQRFVMDPTGKSFGAASGVVLLGYALFQVVFVPLVPRA